MFWIDPAAPKGRRLVVGSWGPILGDQGSGTWIGEQALRAAVAALEGLGQKDDPLRPHPRALEPCPGYDLVQAIHKSPSPFAKVAQATRIVGEACAKGDAVAQAIVREAGELMARQTFA